MYKIKGKNNINILTIDAGGTFFKSAIVSHKGEIFNGSYEQTPISSEGRISDILKVYREIIRRTSSYVRSFGLNICGIGIATPGPFDYENGISYMEHKFKELKGINLKNKIYTLGIPEELPIFFMHDTHAFLMGEYWVGAAQGVDNVAAITLGTGLGFGIMKNGKILDNEKGGPHISIFNISYKEATLEDIISRYGIIFRYQQYTGNKNNCIDVLDIANEARKKNMIAIKVFQEMGEILAEELMKILVDFDIELVVFGGQISKSFDLFGPFFKNKLNCLKKTIKVLPGKDIECSSLKGVAKEVISHYRNKGNLLL